jgi:integrase
MLPDQVRRCVHDKHYSLRTEEAYVYWIRWYIRVHAMKHPMDIGVDDIKRFLSYLTNERQVSVSTHKQALCALLFLYRQVLQTDFPWMDDIYRSNRPPRLPRLPAVLSPWEVSAVFDEMQATHALLARLMYGTGMRLMECMTLRFKDVDFGRREIIIREGKGRKDRVTMLPIALTTPLREQIDYAKGLYSADCAAMRPGVMLPDALERKYPKVGAQWEMVLGISLRSRIDRSALRHRPASSHVRADVPAGSQAGSRSSQADEAGDVPHLPPFVCHPLAGIGI